MAELFLGEPERTANNRVYQGRFVCRDIQWTGSGEDLMATFTITAGELADAAASGLIWTDQDVQRGVKPEAGSVLRELSLADGYPDPKSYIFGVEKSDEIADKLLHGKRLFLSPLIWNLRPGHFRAFRDDEDASLYIYDGKIYLPDSHHRQQAIIKAVRIWRDSPKSYPKFNSSKQFKIDLYFLSRADEGNFFFDKNQQTRPVAKSKAFDLTTDDALSILAKRTIENSTALMGNVNRVTDRLISSNPDVITLSTLREMMKTFAGSDFIDEVEMEGLSVIAGEFFDMLAAARPELGRLSPASRQTVRDDLLVDSAVMMHGYAALMKLFNLDIGPLGSTKAKSKWQELLKRLSKENIYSYKQQWEGDLFSRKNPLWQATGILKPGRDEGRLTITNSGATRIECGRILRQLLLVGQQPQDLAFLVGA